MSRDLINIVSKKANESPKIESDKIKMTYNGYHFKGLQ